VEPNTGGGLGENRRGDGLASGKSIYIYTYTYIDPHVYLYTYYRYPYLSIN